MSLRILFVLSALVAVSFGSRCKFRYRESRVNEQVIRVTRNCHGRLSLAGEEYWASIGYDGRLRDGRTTSDFLTVPQSGGGQVRDGWIAYWITKDRYPDGRHYEVFGHAHLRSDGRVCAWFAGRDGEVVELCEGFRVLSRNRNNPSEDMPFEWILAGYARPREAIGFHRHRIAKYESSPDDIFYGDANVRERRFRGVSPQSRFLTELSDPEQFIRKVYVLRRKPEVAAALEAQYYSQIRPDRRYESRTYSQQAGQSFPRGDEAALRGYPYNLQGSAQHQTPAVGAGAQSAWPRPSSHQERTGEGADHEVLGAQYGAGSAWPYPANQEKDYRQPQSEAAIDGSTDQTDYYRHENQDDRRMAVDSRTAIRQGAHHVQSTHHRSNHLEVPQHLRASPDNVVDPNAIIPEPRPTHHDLQPDWIETQRTETESGSMPVTQPRDEVRVRYVKPAVIVTDQYGRRYRTRVEDGQTYYYAEQDTAPEGRKKDDRREQDAEGWRTVEPEEPQSKPQQDYGQVLQQDTRNRQDNYEARRRAYHEEYNRALQQRRLEEQRRREEEEKRRAELTARQEVARQHGRDRSRYQPELIDKEDPRYGPYLRILTLEQRRRYLMYFMLRRELIRVIGPIADHDNAGSPRDLSNVSGEVSQYPKRLPAPRPLLKEELENDDQ